MTPPKSVYLDNQSCTMPDDRVTKAMLPYVGEVYGNPQSVHSRGAAAKDVLDEARQKTASFLNAAPREIIFASCGSEANNLAVKGTAAARQADGRHIIVSAIEHFSVLHAAKRLAKSGFELTVIGVDKYGTVMFDQLAEAIRPDTILVSIQHSNTEVGTVQPVKKIAEIIRSKNPKAAIHTDAVGSAGMIPLDVKNLGVDMLTIAAPQFHGPKGAAALYAAKTARIVPQIDGGIQEDGRRAGTENLAAIVGMGMACRIASAEIAENAPKIAALRNRLAEGIISKIPHVYLNGHPHERLPGNLNLSVEFIEGEGMLLFLDQKGIAASSGSACTSKALKLSHVLEAMNIDVAVAQGSLLFSLSKYNTADDIDYVIAELPPIVERLRSMSPTYAHFVKTGERMKVGPGTDYGHHDH
jgi:cysteine desulfurase